MTVTAEPGFRMTERHWQALILSLSAAVVLVTAWCLTHGITIVFMHLYYFPIVLLAYHYRYRGFLLAMVLALAYVWLVYLFQGGETDILLGAWFRFLAFAGIAGVIAYLSDLLDRAYRAEQNVTDEYFRQKQFQESVIANANIWISVLSPDGTLLVWNDAAEAISGYQRAGVVGKRAVWKQLYPDAEYRRKVTAEIGQIIRRNNYLENFETVIRCADGSDKTMVWNTRSMRDTAGSVVGYIAIGRDVTAQKDAERRAGESEEKYRHLFDTMQEGFAYCRMIYDREGQPEDFIYLAVNPAFDRIVGIPTVTGRRVTEVFPGICEEFPRLFEVYGRVARTGMPETFEIEFRPVGRWLNISVYSPEKDHFVAVFWDITERRQIETSLRESELFNRGLVENLPEYLCIYGMDGKILYVNRASAEALGYDPGTLGGTSVLTYIPDEYHDRVKVMMKTRLSGDTSPYEIELFTKGGVRRSVLIRASPIQYQGKPAILLLLIDITERRIEEERIRRSNLILAAQQETSPDGILVVDESDRIVSFNTQFVRIMGIPPELVAARDDGPVLAFVTRQMADPEGFLSRVKYLYEHREEKSSEEIRLVGGQVIDRYSTPMLGEDGRYYGRVWYFHDITERRTAEEALRESEKRYRDMFEINNAVMLIVDPQTGRIVDANAAACRFYGYGREELVGMAITQINTADPEETRKNMARANDSRGAEFLFRHRKKSGEIRDVQVFSGPVELGGRRLLHSIIQDVTDRKRAEEALRGSEEKYRTLAEASPDQIFINDRDGTILYANMTGLQLFGLPPDRVIGKKRRDLFPPEMAREHDAAFAKVFDTGEPFRQESRVRFGDQEQWIDANLIPLKDTTGRVTAVLGVARDITGRRQMEDALRESRQLFADIISFLPDPTFVIDRNGTVIAWNQALERMSSVPASGIVGKGNFEYSFWQYGKRRPILIDLVQHPDQDAARMNYTSISREGSAVMAETRITFSSGSTLDFSLVASPLFDSQGKITGAIESMRDITRIKATEAELERLNAHLESIVRDRTRALEEEITQRIQAERDLQKAYDYTRSVIEANPDLMAVLDLKGVILDVNSAAETLTGLPREQLIGTSYSRYLMDNTTPQDILTQLHEKGAVTYTVQLKRQDGHHTPLAVSSTLFKGTDATDARIIIAAHDITSQKEAETVIRASLDEKVILLREIHHRVKNNLQIIISLTNLQMRTIDDPRLKLIMAETKNRVRAMSIVHEKLYQSETLSSIDLGDYIRFLSSQLYAFYTIEHQRIELRTDFEIIPLDINTAIPLGLILNELISNALKHAFPDNRKGTLTLSGHVHDGRITILVSDDGAGIRPGFDISGAESLGMRLVTSLADQLNGTVLYETGKGTTVTITIPEKRER